MNEMENVQTAEKSPFLQTHSLPIRIWHWLTFLTIFFLIITVLFNSTLFQTGKNISMVQNVLKDKGVLITEDQAKAVAHEYGDKLWDLHKYLGLALIFLLLSRVVIEITQAKDEKIQIRIKNAMNVIKQNRPDKNDYNHYLLVKYSYSLFYLLLLIMGTTGFLLAFGSSFGISHASHHWIKEVHGFGQYAIYLFVSFHLCGVVIADQKKSKGLISGMVNNGK